MVTKKKGAKTRKKLVKKKGSKKASKKVSKEKASALPKRIPTGIKNFDKLVEGGFDRNSTNLIVGNSGAGKSIFATQFLVEGIKKGEKGLYITFEEKKEEFFENMSSFGWNLEELEKKGAFVFLEYSPEKVRTMLEEGGGIIENIVLRKKVTRVVIDSITSFELLFDSDIEKREASISLFNLLRKWNCTSLLTYEGNPFKVNSSTGTVSFESDAIILLYFLRGKKQRERFIEVLKMRGTKHSRYVYPASIGDKGIQVGTRPFLGTLNES
jgi:circadian clock protein KaiC